MKYPIGILCGGLATRLKPLTEKIPKSLVSINGKPFIDWQLQLLSSSGFKEVVLLVGHQGELIKSHVGRGKKYGINVEYSFDGDIKRGTGGAIVNAIGLLGPIFSITYGDSYLPMDFAKAENVFISSNKLSLMSISLNTNSRHASNVEYANGELIQYSKQAPSPKMKFIDYGHSMFNAKAFDDCKELQTFDLSLLSEKLSKQMQLEPFLVEKRFYEIGSFQGIKDLESFLKGRSK